jgi:uncharacterized protein
MSTLRRQAQAIEAIPMRVASLAIDPLTTLPVVVLQDDIGGAAAFIRVGAGDASAIAAELEDIELTRPTTHRLMGELLEGAGVRVVAVEIDAVVDPVEEGSFFGVIHLELPTGERVRRESRSSDAIALALRAGAEILVAPAVVERAQVDDEAPWLPSAPATLELVGSDDALERCEAPVEWPSKWRM